jgi:hypothetical protein
MLICLIFAVSPSSILKLIATRLRSSGVIVVVIVAAYLPRDRYWRFNSCSAFSSVARSKVRETATPTSFRPLIN